MVFLTLSLFCLIALFLVLSLTNLIVFQLCSVFAIIPFILCISWIITDSIRRYLLPNKSIESEGLSVLITGCDTGFGFASAQLLNQKGWHVFACVLSECSDGAKQLESLGCTVIQMDVTIDSDVCNAYQIVLSECVSRNTKLWAIVNNAGVMTCGPIEWSQMQEFDRVVQINVYGYVRIIRQFLPLIRKSKGRIINISSCSAIFTAPGIITYSMSKHAISSLTDGLRRELQRTGVKVIEVIPQAYLTQMSYTIVETLDRIWRETAPEVQNDFGDEYHKRFESYIKYYVKITSDKHHEVLNPIINAITKRRVYSKYLCCSPFNRIIMWSFNWLPIEWLDPIVPFCTIRAIPKWAVEPKKTKTNEVLNV